MPQPTGPLPAFVSAPEQVLRRLELTVGRRLDGLLQGDYAGLLPGPGSEPADSRVYLPGDDVRRMDWSVTARTTVPHVRDPIADRELETWALLDLSPSMSFGTARCEKRDVAIGALAAVGFLTARSGNRLGARVLADGVRTLPARSGRRQLLALLRAVLDTPRGDVAAVPPRLAGAVRRGPDGAPTASAAPDLAAALGAMDRPPRRRGLAVVISDFLGPEAAAGPPPWERPLRALGARHDVVAIEVVDPRELELPDVGLLTLVDPETGRQREVQTARGSLRERYAQAAALQREAHRRAVQRAGVAHLVLRTDRDWVLDLARFVAARRHRAAGISRIRSAR